MSLESSESERRNAKRAGRAVPILSWLTPLGAIVSVLNVSISMSTGEWLKSYERIPVESPNVTHREEFQIKRTVSGLWNLCYANMSYELELHCFSIDYFAKDRYTPDPHDSTMAIPYAVTRAGPLFIVSSILLSFGIFSAAFGHIWRSRRVAMFIAGIIFIVAGLIMLIGLVVYLSVLQSEIGPKLRPRNSLDAPLFSYYYGYGFILVVTGFMSTELTGISAIFLYMYTKQLDWAQKTLLLAHRSPAGNLSRSSGSRYDGGSYVGNRSPGFSMAPHSHSESQFSGHRNSKSRSVKNSRRTPGDGSYFTYTNRKCGLHDSESCTGSHIIHCSHDRKKANYGSYFYEDDFDLELPLPPPPPLPRDLTSTTNISGDEYYPAREKDGKRTTPV